MVLLLFWEAYLYIEKLSGSLSTPLLYQIDSVVPHRDGLKALKFFRDRRTIWRPSTITLIRFAAFVLTVNIHSFN